MLTVTLAQVERVGALFLWLLVLIGLVLVAAVAALYLRKWYSSPDTAPTAGFTLADIRELHRTGQMTDEEFERARALILGQTRRQLEEPSEGKPKNADGLRDVKLEE